MTDDLDLRDHIRTVPDFPKPGIMFRDVTTLFSSPPAMRKMIQGFQDQWADLPYDYVAGIDARGFIIGGALALHLGVGFVPVRKMGKLPAETIAEDYELEYGTATIELHRDAVPAGARVLIVDDLIATGGTALAAINLFRRLDAEIVGCGFLVDLPELGGADRIAEQGVSVRSLCAFKGH
jgi:adenine phosphoribosyltransferase